MTRSGKLPGAGSTMFLKSHTQILIPKGSLMNDQTKLLQQCESQLRAMLRAAFPRFPESVVDDLLQDLAVVLLQKELPDAVRESAATARRYLWWILKRDALDRLRRRELVSLKQIAAGRPGDSTGAGFEPSDPQVWSPASLVAEKERLERRERLLSDVLREFVAECEQAGAWRERELMERLLRGQSREDAAREMEITWNALYVTSAKGRDRLQKLMRQKDVHESVFVTFFGPARDKRPLPENAVPDHQASTVTLIQWLIEEAGALCPTDARLSAFGEARESGPAIAEDKNAFCDVRYHVEDAGCRLCRATLDVLNPPAEGTDP